MDELEQLKAQLAELMSDKQAALAAKEQEAQAAKRNGFMSKFGGMFDNDEEIGDMLIGSINDAGGDIESVTQEAIAEYLLKPIAGWAEKLLSKVGKAITEKVEEVMEGTIPSEGAPAAPPMVDLPEDVGAVPLAEPPSGAPPVDVGGMPPSDAAAGLPPIDTAAPMPGDAGGVPPAPMPDPNAQLPPTLSDERYKNVRPIVLSDERFKTIEPELSDTRLKAIEMLSSVTELSDEDLKDIIFMDKPTEAKQEAKPAAPSVVTSDVNEKNVGAVPAINGLFKDMMDIDPETGRKITSDVNTKVVEPAKPKQEVDFSKLTQQPVDEADAVMKDLSDFGMKNIMSVLGRSW